MHTRENPMPHDALVIGGSYAGLSAALQLVRGAAASWSSTTAAPGTASPLARTAC
jgi:glycine/D-amino acid oxidase-like deaminating enzyme